MQPSITNAIAAPFIDPEVSQALRLKRIARQFIDAYPDIYGLAYAVASDILKKHCTRPLPPDKVHWHRFTSTMSSHRAFTGWEHRGPPVESMTLVELVMHRFSVHDQNAVDDLQVFSGFYTDGPEHGVYGALNEVAMLPRTVLAEFWALDFSAHYRRQVEQFWSANTESFRLLAKGRFLAAAGLARRGNVLQETDLQTVIRCVAPALPEVMTPQLLQARVAPQAGISLRSFDVGGYVAHDIVRIVDGRERQILYMPGRLPAFQVFADETGLREWVKAQCATAAGRTRFTLHFFPSQAAKEQDDGGFDRWIGQLQRGEWSGQRVINRLDQPLSGDVFDHLRQNARQNMLASADLLLTSNGSLRKQMLLGYLNAFVGVFGVFTPLGWPMTLAVVGACAASVGLNIDQAINANSPRLRKAGVLGAVCNSLFVLFNLPLFSALRSAVQDAETPLSEWAGTVVLDAEPAETAPTARMQGVHYLSNGQTWISLEGRPYRVQYHEQWRTWAIVDPANPFAFNGARPVRLDAHGRWQLLPRPGLQGGAPMQPIAGPSPAHTKSFASIRSPFWDVYMRYDLPEEMRLSANALLRQKQVLEIKVFEAGDEVVLDSENNRLLRDRWGNEYRVFREANGSYRGGRIINYTADDTAFNQYLRTGKQAVANQVRLIEELAYDLDSIGVDNAVTLFRGGSGARNTSGLTFRSGRIKVGDLLVNTDFTSFSENPYIARVFSSSQAGVQSALFNGTVTFDETAVVFELPARSYTSAVPVAAFSADWEESESVFRPGVFLRIDQIEEVSGINYAFIRVQLQEVAPVPTSAAQQPGRIFEMRTGEPFTREGFANRLGTQGAALLDLFFPL